MWDDVLTNQWSQFNTANFAAEFPFATRAVPILYAVMSRIANDVAAIKQKFYRRQRNGKRVEIDPLEPGSISERWAYMNGQQSAYEAEIRRQESLDEGGNSYLLIDRGNLPGGPLSSRQIEMRPLPGHRVSVVSDDDFTVKGYDFMHPRKGLVHYEPDAIVPFHYFNNDAMIVGVSPLEALRMSYTATRDALRFQRAFYAKGANVAGIFSTDKGSLVQIDAAEDKLRRKYQGVEAALNPIVLGGGLKFERRGLTFQEMAFLESMRYAAQDVCRVYGMPPVVMGFKEGGGLSDAGASTDAVLYVEGCLKQRVGLRDSVLTEWLCPMFGPGLEAVSDIRSHPALAAQRLDMAKALVTMTGRPIYSVNKALSTIGDDPVDDPTADELHLPPAPQANAFGSNETPPAAKKEAPDDEHAAVREWGLTIRDRDEDFFDEGAWRENLKVVLSDLAEHAGELALAGINVEGLVIDWHKASVASWMQTQAATAIGWITDTTRQRLQTELAQLTGPGSTATYADLVNVIREIYDGRRDNAATAAQTEALSANMFATDHAWRESGVVEGREWITAGDDVVREPHAEVASAGPVPLDEPFLLYDSAGVEHQAMFPGDPILPAELRINCRCVMEAVTVADEQRVFHPQTRIAAQRALAHSTRVLTRFFRSMFDAMERDTISAAKKATKQSKKASIETEVERLLRCGHE